MRFMLMAVLGLSAFALLATPDAAQAQKPSTSAAQRQAPVGHRQPGARDVPSEQGLDQPSKEDRALDKALKSICRGC
jgi:hypothetical protein